MEEAKKAQEDEHNQQVAEEIFPCLMLLSNELVVSDLARFSLIVEMSQCMKFVMQGVIMLICVLIILPVLLHMVVMWRSGGRK